MDSLYKEDLAYIQATAYGSLAQGAAPEIVRRLKSATIQIRKVVDVGCGAGPLSSALVRAGFDVTGIDASAGLLAIAREAVPGAHFMNASIYETEIPPCEAVVAIGEPLTYHAEEADADTLVQALFRRISTGDKIATRLLVPVMMFPAPLRRVLPGAARWRNLWRDQLDRME